MFLRCSETRVLGRSAQVALPNWDQGSPPHAEACLWLCAGEQGARHAVAAGLLGHRNIQHTVRYTELAPDRIYGEFKVAHQSFRFRLEPGRSGQSNVFIAGTKT